MGGGVGGGTCRGNCESLTLGMSFPTQRDASNRAEQGDPAMEHILATLPPRHPPSQWWQQVTALEPRGLAPGFGLGSRLPPSSCPSSLPKAGAAGAPGALSAAPGAAASFLPAWNQRLRRSSGTCKRGTLGEWAGGCLWLELGCSCLPAGAGSRGKTAGALLATGLCVGGGGMLGPLPGGALIYWGGTTLPAWGSW